jgi:hypothetical protein
MKKKWEFRLYCKVKDNDEKYLIWTRTGHYHRGTYKYHRLIELTSAFNGWLDGLFNDFKSKDIDGRIEKGKFNVHYKWNNDFKNNKWIDIKTITQLYYEVWDINLFTNKEKFITERGINIDTETLKKDFEYETTIVKDTDTKED